MAKAPKKNMDARIVDLHLREPVRPYINPGFSHLRLVLPILTIIAFGFLCLSGTYHYLKGQELKQAQLELDNALAVQRGLTSQRDAINERIEFVQINGSWLHASLPSQNFLLELVDEMSPQVRMRKIGIQMTRGYPQLTLTVMVEGQDESSSQEEVARISRLLTRKDFINNGETRLAHGPERMQLEGTYIMPRISDGGIF